ncbi:unnamed protein product [Ilex paraguariensis]|uniref:Uncharacterized protein n=1 Tax=Ilex paraguariensis TaxID=185542 RepID=A0ABC8R8L7_9AQUA
MKNHYEFIPPPGSFQEVLKELEAYHEVTSAGQWKPKGTTDYVSSTFKINLCTTKINNPFHQEAIGSFLLSECAEVASLMSRPFQGFLGVDGLPQWRRDTLKFRRWRDRTPLHDLLVFADHLQVALIARRQKPIELGPLNSVAVVARGGSHTGLCIW